MESKLLLYLMLLVMTLAGGAFCLQTGRSTEAGPVSDSVEEEDMEGFVLDKEQAEVILQAGVDEETAEYILGELNRIFPGVKYVSAESFSGDDGSGVRVTAGNGKAYCVYRYKSGMICWITDADTGKTLYQVYE